MSRTSDDNKRNEKSEKEAVKRARQAEAARLRFFSNFSFWENFL